VADNSNEKKILEDGTRPATHGELFLSFAKIGLMTFGGGVAMLPILQREICETKQWAREEDLMDYYAIGQCTPGIIAVNTATFIGYRKRGIPGGIIATLGVVFPSLVIIMVLARLISTYSTIPAVASAFAGIRVCVCVMILNATVKLYKKAVIDWKTFLIFLLTAAGSYFLSFSPVLYVLVSGGAGILIKELEAKKHE